jgi:2-keto-myo-inositol isomerase
MLIGWNGETLPALALDDEIAVVSHAGFGGLEIFVPKLPPYLASHGPSEQAAAAALGARLKGRGLKPLAMNGLENVNLRSADDFAGVLSQCHWLAGVSREMGCPTIVVVPSPAPDGMAWGQIKREAVVALRALDDVASRYGVKLALEFLAPASCSVRTLAQGSEIVKAAGRPGVGLVLDTYHFFVGGSSWQSLSAVDVQSLFLVHINDVQDLPRATLTDGDRLLPGEGILPLDRILAKLKTRRYDGAYSLEVMRPAYRQRDPAEYIRAALSTTRTALARAGIGV